MTNPLRALWFWTLILSIILLIAFFILFEIQENISTSLWIWAIFAVGIILLIIALILYCININSSKESICLEKECITINNVGCGNKQCVKIMPGECIKKNEYPK